MNEINIIRATAADWKALQVVGKETFMETFADTNSEENMRQYLEDNFTEEVIVAEVENPGSLFFIAWDGELPIAYLKLNLGSAQTEMQDDAALEIQRIYVKQAYQGQKVGQRLYEHALKIARENQKSYVWLGVWERNYKALGFYEKNGFTAFDKHIFVLGDDEQTDIMMKKIL